jgi:hypothetical protein
MSDLDGLHGVFPTSIRFNAEEGILGISVFNHELGERELQEIEFGKPATFCLDLLTRETGYGVIKTGLFDMRLAPVGSPKPPWPGDDDYKAAVGCWLYHPQYGELRLETNAVILTGTISNLWDRCRFEPQAAEGKQPVIRFTGRVARPNKKVGKTFYAPAIDIIGWVERSAVPGWAERPPTVPLPTRTAPLLGNVVPVEPRMTLDQKLDAIAETAGRRKGKATITSGKAKDAPKGPAVDPHLDDDISDIFPPRK